MIRTVRMLWRLLRIARILARFDALAPLEDTGVAPGVVWLARLISRREAPGRPGQKLARALVELGPSFIKFGQALSTRADLLGEQVAEDLAELQDRLAPFDGATARAILFKELNQPLEALFESFEDDPVSAASIAQVHMAVTHEGDPVAVKVLRPGIERAFERDLTLFYWLADVIELTQPKLRRLKPREVVSLFEETVRIEMDLRMEAAAATELAENFAADPSYLTPAVDWARSSRRVLTMGRVGGIPIDDREALLAAGHDLEVVMTRAAAIFFKQVFRDGFFHGDQHAGNMSVGAKGEIVAVDFGIMGRLDLKTRRSLADMLIATLARDYQRLAQVNVEAGFLPPGRPPESFAQALRAVCEPISGRPLNEISFARLLAQLLQLTESYDMPVQPQLLLLQKNMLMAEGISRQLVPDLNIWSLAQPLIEDWIRENRGPEARLREGAESLIGSLERLPDTLRNIESAAARAASGNVRLHPETFEALGARRDAAAWHIRALWLVVVILAVLLFLR
jgi:ubiquinone biosynthesis protein